MGDRTHTSIRFSGAIKRADVPRLVKELQEQGCCSGITCEWVVDGDLETATYFYDDECNYAQMTGVEDLAKELNISYLKEWADGGNYGPGMQMYNALIGETFDCAEYEGDLVAALSWLKQTKIEDVIAYLEAFQNWEKNNPSLEIVD